MRVLSLVTNDRARFYRQQTAGLRDRGHVVDTLAVPGSRDESGDSVDHRPMSAYLKYYPRAVREAFRGYDLVHANYGLTAPPAVVQPSCPVVLSLWGSDLMGEYGWLSRACSRAAEEVVVMSEEMAGYLDGDCHVVPHGIDLRRFRPLPADAARRELGWRDDAAHVLFPYPSSRGVKDFPRARGIVDDVAAADELDRPVEIHTVSGVPHDRMPWYMNAADALLLTSKREGSPNSVKEALACDLPVVSTDVGDVRSRLRGVTPSAVSDDDAELVAALTRILHAGERSDGRESIAHLGLEHQLTRIERIYRSALDA
ncbi:glycosyltransferase [Halorubrum sp. JWXQ-INN 858]|uniref:glycosyltransferase family 4 protein n=1 Tax=Halorubrum sp. JWXQ-INN 858 TaxID=2690782 RepID=UPI0013FADD62|nr:glycosyltransferase family 4 protein [Halorubrum sp. JWXQ-INN 858]MWV65484.1 glycosyltransferase [Halorubrum sp. JWXQ-INN 858]